MYTDNSASVQINCINEQQVKDENKHEKLQKMKMLTSKTLKQCS